MLVYTEVRKVKGRQEVWCSEWKEHGFEVTQTEFESQL